ncbi:hypothetical protein LTR78_009615 [Recurvomyces mirabilis]|uniref:Ubiquitin 3 binding protein But2 C-terminal domain-containing protein n=1 Tax=Recurvomyces mirabilis TaxID=574656 RepID=A0AAE0TRA2_9PEZI|nr:hypothetical protein LTR78_009615 [Recurvomyces mirabilis]KAK5156614.1 hypothetical protein LTS14_004826 [Recurvomyces mirabilis]
MLAPLGMFLLLACLLCADDAAPAQQVDTRATMAAPSPSIITVTVISASTTSPLASSAGPTTMTPGSAPTTTAVLSSPPFDPAKLTTATITPFSNTKSSMLLIFTNPAPGLNDDTNDCVFRLMVDDYKDVWQDSHGFWAKKDHPGPEHTAVYLAMDAPNPTCSTYRREIVTASAPARFETSRMPDPPKEAGFICPNAGPWGKEKVDCYRAFSDTRYNTNGHGAQTRA